MIGKLRLQRREVDVDWNTSGRNGIWKSSSYWSVLFSNIIMCPD